MSATATRQQALPPKLSRVRRRLIWTGASLLALGLYFSSVVWMGRMFADDVRDGMHEIDTAVVFPESKR